MGEFRWLDERETRAWRGYLRMQRLLNLQIARDLDRDAGLSDADYTVLAILAETQDQRMRSMNLAGRAAWSKSRLSHHLGRMEERGLVERQSPPDDTRAVDAVLTDEGMRVLAAAAPGHIASVRRHFLDLLTDHELDVFAEVAQRVMAHLDDVHHRT